MRQLKIGDMRIDRLVEIPALPLEKEFLFANVTDEVIAANRGWLDERFIEPENEPLHSQPSFLCRAHVPLDCDCRYLLRQSQGTSGRTVLAPAQSTLS